MTLEQLLALLDSGEITKETAAQGKQVILDAIEAEKNKGITSYQSKDKEVLKYKAAVKKLGYSKEEVDGLDAFIESLASKSASADGKDVTIAELKSNITSITKRLDDEAAEKTALAEKHGNTRAQMELQKSIGDKFVGADTIIENLLLSKRVSVVDDKVVFKDGENIVTFEDGVKALEEKYKGQIKSNQAGGANTTQGGSGLPPKKLNEMTADEGLAALGLE